jgi:hypothetical protein
MGGVNFIFTYKGIFERMKANWYNNNINNILYLFASSEKIIFLNNQGYVLAQAGMT